MRVLKFGGTSVANAERFLQVVDIIKDYSSRSQVGLVLSAPAKITNHLVAMVDKTVLGESIESHFNEAHEIFNALLTGLKQKVPAFDLVGLQKLVDTEFKGIKDNLEGVRLLGLCPDKVNASLICRGEKLSIAIMQGLLQSLGYGVSVIDPVTTLLAKGQYLESTVDITTSTQRVNALNLPKDPNHVILMAGFTAGNEKGELVVLGRNGSDYSAAVLAACTRAEACEIWTDVDGVYTCDPRSIPDARLIPSLSYKEAMELSYFGAKVLHPRTIAPIARLGIPCLIKNTGNPRASGSIITEICEDNTYPIKGITHLSDVAMINVSGPGMKGMVGMAAKVFETMSLAGISVILITQSSSEYSISFCVPQKELKRAEQALNDAFRLELKEGALDTLDIIEHQAIISVVGDGMKTQKGISARFFKALANANINIVAIAQGSSERSISAVIDDKKAKIAVMATHEALFRTAHVIELFLVGVGGVGSALIEQVKTQQVALKKKDIDLRVCGIANSKKMVLNAWGLDLNQWEVALEQSSSGFDFNELKGWVDAHHLLNPVIVDNTSNQSISDQYVDFLAAGFHVVTPNKKANTSTYAYYQLLRETARKSRRKFMYETNVGAGLPVIENLQNLLSAGDELQAFTGILSGSLSYIFGKLDEGKSLSDATLEAKKLGFTEPDPRDDLSGMDVARKVLILAREAGYPLELKDIEVEGVVSQEFAGNDSVEDFLARLPSLDASFKERTEKAKAVGMVLRYVGEIDNGRCFVRIIEVDGDNPLYKVKNGENALAFYSRFYQPIPLVLRGYGAGNEVTAAGVFSDILRLHANR
ncbi:bifunctional aspartate kinase/homoserine dehydrogenase I [Thorsellia kenyensis]|uniref:Bifunctional aspartokinase/homoserine dehydrogenase n=1 Tax=Thorsellia kenyensis TaxID=1549888 RepID=A0ABV6CC37_9GAMM